MSSDQPANRLDVRTLAVLGEGLAAGLGPFGLSASYQRRSFPTLLAQQLDVALPQPLLQAPGIGHAPGQAPLPVIVPDLLQTSVLETLPTRDHPFGHLAVPGFRVDDVLDRRPTPPIVRRDDPTQTLTNLILGMPSLEWRGTPQSTAVEHARARRAQLVLIALGYTELVEALVDGAPLPDADAFAASMRRVLEALPDAAHIVLATVPDPAATAWLADRHALAALCATTPDFLAAQYGLAADDRVTLPGQLAIGHALMARQPERVTLDGRIVSAGDRRRFADATTAINAALSRLAIDDARVVLHDLHGVFQRAAAPGGIEVPGGKPVGRGLLDGFYQLNGLYPSATGHALIADDLVARLNQHFGAGYARIDVAAVQIDDPMALATLPPGPPSTDRFRVARTPADLPPFEMPPPEALPPEIPIQTTYPNQPGKADCDPLIGVPGGGLPDPKRHVPLELPEGLRQTLTLNPAGSYFGDALRVVDSPGDRPIFPGFPAFGLGGDTLFDGLLLTDSPLRGELEIVFGEPDARGVSRFEVRHPNGLVGDDGDLAGPRGWFRMPSQLNFVQDIPGRVSWGELDLATGIVTNLHYNVLFINTAILALFGVNPHLPRVPMMFPGPPNGGSTAARFEQRSDGRLDFTFGGHLFLPLGVAVGDAPVRLPLPFSTPDLACASVPARGLSLHPHLHLTTAERVGAGDDAQRPARAIAPDAMPTDTVREYVVAGHSTSFGDEFGLVADALGGTGTGRAHLQGRVRVQFGPRNGDLLPFATAVLPPGGLLSDAPAPLPYLPPGVSRGMPGYNEILRFPKETYPQSDLAYIDDPFNLSVGAIHLPTGEVVGDLLRPGYVGQALFTALLQAEPCTPQSSFNYAGPACFEAGLGDAAVLRFDGEVFIPYPAGFKFPYPDGQRAFVVDAGSRLDPFQRIQAMDASPPPADGLRGGADDLMSSTGRRFGYAFDFPGANGGGPSTFTYVDHDADGTFTLTSLTWIAFSASRGADAVDTVTFAGFGTWNQPGRDANPRTGAMHQVTAHVSLAADAPYVGIQIDGGSTSNANTKPADMATTLP
ncbi:MAG: hypothetical protein AAF772_15095 [Acidobacteriota bacterium]